MTLVLAVRCILQVLKVAAFEFRVCSGRGHCLGGAVTAGFVFREPPGSFRVLSTSGFPFRLRLELPIDWKFPGLPEKTVDRRGSQT
ncbi:MAG TPA: hypothetical protein DC058_05520 [Planctomycetaceae bacterium]|nr:hypothetical protein [Planctomycetaceae bacterium]HBC60660.1 hypothetical protein [Planctomycetaceae bacterium]